MNPRGDRAAWSAVRRSRFRTAQYTATPAVRAVISAITRATSPRVPHRSTVPVMSIWTGTGPVGP